MNWRPGKTLSHDLGLPLFEGRELLVVHVEEFEQVFQDLNNLLVDPWTILEFDHQVEGVDHGKVFKTEFIIFQVVEEHADNAHNLLFVEEVQDLRHMLDDVKLEVSESFHSEVVVRQDPQSAAHIVCDLSIGQTIILKNFLEDVESHLAYKNLSEFINFKEIHETVSVGIFGQHLLVILEFNQVLEEVICIVLALCVSMGLNQHGQHMGSQVSLVTVLWFGLLSDIRVENLDAVEVLILLLGLLNVFKML